MLRRKLLLNLGPVIGLLLVTAVVAIILLQGVLRRMDEVNREAWTVGEDVNSLGVVIHTIEVSLFELRLDEQKPLDDLIKAVEQAQMLVDRIGNDRMCDTDMCRPLYLQIKNQLPEFRRHVSALATTQDQALAMHHHDLTLAGAAAMRRDILPLSRCVHDTARAEQEALSTRFRWVVLGLSIVFVVAINISVVVLLHLGRMILRPIGYLIEATHQLSRDNLDYRVQFDGADEFAQLAQVYNSLAERLQANEKRKMETLGQVGLAMNHELNNVISIISLQLKLAGRQAPQNPALEACLQQIQGSVTRMTDAVRMLKNVRRIVLTDYVSGMKMLDLRKSAEQELSPTESTNR